MLSALVDTISGFVKTFFFDVNKFTMVAWTEEVPNIPTLKKNWLELHLNRRISGEFDDGNRSNFDS
ncbi:hypothetical protein ACTXT7_004194 [Hymenolepis weldensis]